MKNLLFILVILMVGCSLVPRDKSINDSDKMKKIEKNALKKYGILKQDILSRGIKAKIDNSQRSNWIEIPDAFKRLGVRSGYSINPYHHKFFIPCRWFSHRYMGINGDSVFTEVIFDEDNKMIFLEKLSGDSVIVKIEEGGWISLSLYSKSDNYVQYQSYFSHPDQSERIDDLITVIKGFEKEFKGKYKTTYSIRLIKWLKPREYRLLTKVKYSSKESKVFEDRFILPHGFEIRVESQKYLIIIDKRRGFVVNYDFYSGDYCSDAVIAYPIDMFADGDFRYHAYMLDGDFGNKANVPIKNWKRYLNSLEDAAYKADVSKTVKIRRGDNQIHARGYTREGFVELKSNTGNSSIWYDPKKKDFFLKGYPWNDDFTIVQHSQGYLILSGTQLRDAGTKIAKGKWKLTFIFEDSKKQYKVEELDIKITEKK